MRLVFAAAGVFLLVLAGAGCSSTNVSRSLGASCSASSDCDETCLTCPNDFPGGFCTTSCTSDAECATDALCTKVGGTGVCLFKCVDNADCSFLGTFNSKSYSCKFKTGPGTTGAAVQVCFGNG